MNRCTDSIADAAKVFRDAFDYDPGYSDLDDEQPITIGITLGDWRRLNMALAAPQEAEAGAVQETTPAVAALRASADRWHASQLEWEAKARKSGPNGEPVAWMDEAGVNFLRHDTKVHWEKMGWHPDILPRYTIPVYRFDATNGSQS